MADAPSSPQMRMLLRLKELLESDPDLQEYFGWEPAPADPNDDWETRRRIFLDDNGSVTPEQSPKLCLTEFVQLDDFNVLGDGADIESDIFAHIAQVVYVYVGPTDDPEAAKVRVGNLHAAVRRVTRQHVYESNGMWANLEYMFPSCAFDQSDGFRRAGGIVALAKQEKIT